MPGYAKAGRSMASPISTPRCAIPRSRPRCAGSMIAATACTRAIAAIARWATRSTLHCSIDGDRREEHPMGRNHTTQSVEGLAGPRATGNMNRARLLQLGFELGARALGGRSQGAWFATAPDGAPIVLKWSPDETIADRYAVLL